MKVFFMLLLMVCAVSASAQDGKGVVTNKPVENIVFREPFTLKLHIDKDFFYEEKFGKIPYVDKGDVYLFKGEEFGLTLEMQDNSIRAVKYEPDIKKADVTFKFTQEIAKDEPPGMILVTHNSTKHTLLMDAFMTVPGREGIRKTTILPVKSGQSGYERWPHAIIQLVLRNIRID